MPARSHVAGRCVHEIPQQGDGVRFRRQRVSHIALGDQELRRAGLFFQVPLEPVGPVRPASRNGRHGQAAICRDFIDPFRQLARERSDCQRILSVADAAQNMRKATFRARHQHHLTCPALERLRRCNRTGGRERIVLQGFEGISGIQPDADRPVGTGGETLVHENGLVRASVNGVCAGVNPSLTPTGPDSRGNDPDSNPERSHVQSQNLTGCTCCRPGRYLGLRLDA
jgi:hypothetical protein